jgi:H/ACA ribonucleoprotein complex subunit 4
MVSLLPFEKIEREIFVRKEAETSAKYSVYPFSTLELLNYGIVNIDKPKGPTSHQVSAYIQKILGLKKAGHSGTLDPNVTGVLPVALGRATRIVQTLLNAGKEYVAVMHLHKEISEDEIRKVCSLFVGKIKQLPPIKSAIKRQWRFRKVYYIDIMEVDGKDVLMKIGCQAGTYIRKLIHDIGAKVGGAHMAELRRTKAGPFNEETLVSLQDLSDAFYYYTKGNDKYLRKLVKPIEYGVHHLAKIWVLDSTAESLCHGVNLKVPGIAKAESEIQVDDPVAVMTLKNELIAVGRSKMVSKDLIKAEKGVAVSVDKVFMEPGTYPKIEKKV